MKIDPTDNSAVTQLAGRLEGLLHTVEHTVAYRDVFGLQTSRDIVRGTLREVFRDVATYQPHVTEATFTAIGRLPKIESLVRLMVLQQVEEVEHADMARRDFLRLGGDPALLATLTPAAASVAATCHFLAEHCHPASYLGFMYIFEALTPTMAKRVQRAMAAHADPEANEFVDLHAVEDIRHTDQVMMMIQQLVQIDPEAADAILWGFDAFAAVYPIALWSAAHARAVASLEPALG